MKKAIAIIALVAAAAGCSSYNDARGKGDAPVKRQIDAPREVVAMPDGFPNLAIVCDGKTAIFVNTRDGGNMIAVPNSTFCGGES